ncbi:MAG TPA: hypothetical protein VJ901_09870 [Thermoanaerobaculia bacterium]|nr:hypothetical protein [Thermoanaerobaculia bacterium]
MIHFHNGDITASLARRAGVSGRHVPFRESLVGGPVRRELNQLDWVEERAKYLAEEHEQNLLRTRNELLEQEKAIDGARSEEEIVLWFEHDLFCLVHLLYLAKRFANCRVSVVWNPTPISMLEPDNVLALFRSRAPMLPVMVRAGDAAWQAYTSDDPTALNRFLRQDIPDFPFLVDGLRLHASRFPSVKNGLGAPEQKMLELIDFGAPDFGTLFGRFNPNPPRYGFGDGEVLRHLRRLAWCAVPMITMSEVKGEGEPPKASFAVTPAGRNVLEGTVDFLDVNTPNDWLGGAHLTSQKVWRWDAERGLLV